VGVMVVGFHGGRDMSWRGAILVVLCSTALAAGVVWLLSILRF